MPAISSFIEVLPSPGDSCADCNHEPATHRLIENRDGVESRALLCKGCLDRRFSQLGIKDPFETGTCDFCGSPNGVCNEDPLLKMAGIPAQSRFACSRCTIVRSRFQLEAFRELQQEGGSMDAYLKKIPAILAETDGRTREYIQEHPPRVNPRVCLIPSMNGMAEMIAKPHAPCEKCGAAPATYRVWRVMEAPEIEVRLCEQCLPEKSDFMALDFVPEDALCCCCGAPASAPVLKSGTSGEASSPDEYECMRCSRLGGRFLDEAMNAGGQIMMKQGGLDGMAEIYREVRQKVRDYLRDHPE